MRILIIALLVAMLFLAGCPGAGTGQKGTTGTTSQGTGTQGAGTQQGGLLGGSSGASGGAGTSGGTQGGSSGGNNPFANWDMQAMVAAGQPVYCEVTYNSNGVSDTQKMYIKGENMRVEMTSLVEGQATQTVMIIKGKMQYMQPQQPMQLTQGATCDWVSIDSEKLKACMPQGTTPQEGVDTAKYNETPANYNCNYGTFGDEKFTVPSIPASCDLSTQLCNAYAAMNQAGAGGYGNAMSACSGLTGQALQECVQAQYGTGS